MKPLIKNPFYDFFKLIFVGVFGAVSAHATIALFSAIFVGIGFYLIDYYNKPDTKMLKELQPGQYIGILFAFIGFLPYLQYFFMSFMFEAGSFALHELIDQ